jgi:hypothetical protein
MPTFNLSALVADIDTQSFGIDFWTQALLENNTMSMVGRYGEIKTGVKKDTVQLPLLSAPVTLVAAGCGDEAGPVPAITTREMKMVGFKASGEFCPHELEEFYTADYIPAGQHYTDFQPLQNAIVNELTRNIAKKMAIFPWYGPTGTDTVTYAEAWMDQLNDASNIWVGGAAINDGGANGTDVNGAYNVAQALIAKFLANADAAGEVYEDEQIIIGIAPSAVDLYFRNYQTLYGTHNITPSYEILANGQALGGWFHPGTRVRIVIQNALGVGGQMVAFRRGNLVLGVDLASDITTMKLWYSQDDDLVKWRMKAKIGTGIRSITNANLPATIAPNIVYWSAAS